jgi:peptidoglycan-N-acetylglucosamine deacetylase
VRAVGRAAAALAAGSVATHFLPSVLTVPALHRRVVPRLSGRTKSRHIALTFDDGPNPVSTPLVLDELERLDVRATFFLLGNEMAAHPSTARSIVARGHEVAVHGWAHLPHLLRTPSGVHNDVARAFRAILATTGVRPRFWRPPNGIVTGSGLVIARRLGLQPVLWTADGQDWRADATPASVVARVDRQLDAGGTVLLHDSDVTSAAGSWRTTLAALPDLVDLCRDRGCLVGPLGEHWST